MRSALPITESKFFNAASPTVTVLVEGGIDQRFWRVHCHKKCLVRHAERGGRQGVLDQLDQLKRGGNDDAVLLGILDADFDYLEGGVSARPDVVWTDAHDLETTLLGLPTLEKVVAHHVDPAKLMEREQSWEESLRARLFRHAEGMGRLRRLKSRGEIQALCFKRSTPSYKIFAKYDDCVGKEWAPSLLKVIAAIINYSSAQTLQSEDLKDACAQLPAAKSEYVCNGHDLMGFLHAWLKSVGGRSTRKMTVDMLAENVCLACERAWLAETAMWKALHAWEKKHPGFRVLS